MKGAMGEATGPTAEPPAPFSVSFSKIPKQTGLPLWFRLNFQNQDLTQNAQPMQKKKNKKKPDKL